MSVQETALLAAQNYVKGKDDMHAKLATVSVYCAVRTYLSLS
jgi:hypothetical protein